jgi:hypothetical protein
MVKPWPQVWKKGGSYPGASVLRPIQIIFLAALLFIPLFELEEQTGRLLAVFSIFFIFSKTQHRSDRRPCSYYFDQVCNCALALLHRVMPCPL